MARGGQAVGQRLPLSGPDSGLEAPVDAAVRPNCRIVSYVDRPGFCRVRNALIAQNVGIGPARVIDFRVAVDGEHYTTWDAAIRNLAGVDSRVAYAMSTINGRTIPPDKTIEMFKLSDLVYLDAILDDFERVDFEACYCSWQSPAVCQVYQQLTGSPCVPACRVY